MSFDTLCRIRRLFVSDPSLARVFSSAATSSTASTATDNNAPHPQPQQQQPLPHRHLNPYSLPANYDWSHPRRDILYPLPRPRTRFWINLHSTDNTAVDIVVLSKDTPGFIVAHPDGTGNLRVASYEHIPDLLFWQPARFFASHPNVESVWIENEDENDPVELVEDATIAEPVPLALILRRREVTYTLCDFIRDVQYNFFRRLDLLLPAASEFRDNFPARLLRH